MGKNIERNSPKGEKKEEIANDRKRHFAMLKNRYYKRETTGNWEGREIAT